MSLRMLAILAECNDEKERRRESSHFINTCKCKNIYLFFFFFGFIVKD